MPTDGLISWKEAGKFCEDPAFATHVEVLAAQRAYEEGYRNGYARGLGKSLDVPVGPPPRLPKRQSQAFDPRDAEAPPPPDPCWPDDCNDDHEHGGPTLAMRIRRILQERKNKR